MNFIFVHGLIGEPSNWDLVVEPLIERGVNCIIPEIPYFDEDTYLIEDFAEQTWSKLPHDVVGSDAIIVGNSLGCSIALCLADRFSSAYLVAPFTKMYSYTLPRSDSNIAGLLKSLVHDPSRLRENEVAKHVDRYRALLDSKGRRHHLQKLRKIKGAAEAFDHAGHYDAHQNKLHMVYAGNDEVSPPSTFEQMKRDFPGMTLHEVPDCGHAVPMERPRQLADILLDAVPASFFDALEPHAIPAE